MTLALALNLSTGIWALPADSLPTVSEQLDSATLDELEAFSDTTSSAASASAPVDWDVDDTDWEAETVSDVVDQIVQSVGGRELTAMIIVLVVLVLLFIVAPLLLFILLFWLILRNRKTRLKMAEEARKEGNPLPSTDPIYTTSAPPTDEVRTRGIRQVCLGVGLMILLGQMAGKIGFCLGVLVLCIGIGNLLIWRSSQNKNQEPL